MIDLSVHFRWLGVAGVEWTVGDQVLIMDPYLTRISFWKQWFGPVFPNRELLRDNIPSCDWILVTHAHWDHLMDVPALAEYTGATVFGSPNTCDLLSLLGLPDRQIREIDPGQSLTLGDFRVEVFGAEHAQVPGFHSGPLRPGLSPPLRARDYRMDSALAFCVQVDDLRVHTDPGCRPWDMPLAQVLLLMPFRGASDYEWMLERAQPRLLVPIHWDDMWRPLSMPLRPMLAPPRWAIPPLQRVNLQQFQQTIAEIAPSVRVWVPDVLARYDLSALLAHRPIGEGLG